MMLLSVRNLTTRFKTPEGSLTAVDDVSFDIEAKQTLGLVGESGCGKSSLAKTLIRLVKPTAGQIKLDGQDIAKLSEAELKSVRPKVQMIFQDPYSSLNPRKTVGQIIEEPLQVNRIGTGAERQERVSWLMDRVGLRTEAFRSYPHELSGGQRQRVGIARALALRPRLVICDEPVSALDISIRAQVLNLLSSLQDEFGFSYLFISHDLSVVRHIADRVAVMYLGKLAELGDNEKIWEHPAHPYTKALMAAVPNMRRATKREAGKGVLPGDLPSPINPPAGCRFHTRCQIAETRCSQSEPVYRENSHGHWVACHLANRPVEETT
jgi:oligopeptide/dipeptide ABC transporter ATP-binding protein